jgi:hypothetical protein
MTLSGSSYCPPPSHIFCTHSVMRDRLYVPERTQSGTGVVLGIRVDRERERGRKRVNVKLIHALPHTHTHNGMINVLYMMLHKPYIRTYCTSNYIYHTLSSVYIYMVLFNRQKSAPLVRITENGYYSLRRFNSTLNFPDSYTW